MEKKKTVAYFLKFGRGNTKRHYQMQQVKKHTISGSPIQSISYQFPLWHVAKSLQSCLTLCDPIDGSPPGSPVPGILQARTLEWVAISFSNA